MSPSDVPPEVRRDGDERADVEADVERRVEGVVLLQVRPVEEPGHEDQVAGRGDRQELGQALNDPEHERLPAGQLPWLLADSERRRATAAMRERGAGDAT